MHSFVAPVAIWTLAALLLAGCGSSGPPETSTKARTPIPTAARPAATAEPTPAPLSHEDFVSRLNATCEPRADYQALADQAGVLYDDGAHERAADTLTRAFALAKPSWDRQRRLAEVVPARDARAYRRYLSAQREYQGILRRIVQAFRDGDDAELVFLSDALDDVKKRRLRAAIALGADKCGS